MAIVPYPPATQTATRATALAELKQATVDLLDGMTDADINRLAVMVASHVERYAESAPQEIKDEAMIRAIGWLVQSNTGTVQTEAVGQKSVTYDIRAGAAWFRLSAAQSILEPWRAWNVGIVQTES